MGALREKVENQPEAVKTFTYWFGILAQYYEYQRHPTVRDAYNAKTPMALAQNTNINALTLRTVN